MAKQTYTKDEVVEIITSLLNTVSYEYSVACDGYDVYLYSNWAEKTNAISYGEYSGRCYALSQVEGMLESTIEMVNNDIF